jgi:hypothetical protein
MKHFFFVSVLSISNVGYINIVHCVRGFYSHNIEAYIWGYVIEITLCFAQR